MGLVAFVAAAAAAAAVQGAPARSPQPLPDPAAEPVRVEVRVTTAARTVRLFIREPDDVLLVADARLASGSAPAQAAIEGGGVLALTNNPEGSPAIATFRLVLASDAATSVRFGVGIAPFAQPATVEVFNLNTESQPARVTSVDATSGTEIETSMAPLRTGGPLTTGARRDRLVLAHYYPWWDRASWADGHLLDQPLQIYASDDAADVAREMKDMAAAGIDVAIVSWQGSESRGGFYARGLRVALDAAQQAGIKVAVMLETAAANRSREGQPPDVEVMTGWMNELIDGYATHPAFLKVDAKPVLFAYIWGFAGRDFWQTVIGRVRAGGRQPLVMADTTNPAELALADGTFTYSGTLFEPDVRALLRRSVAAARTYHLLGAAYGAPRVAAASVIPGYDETRLGRDTARSVDRQGGEFYNRQWQAALASGADWVVITSWNEWAENTQIEGGQRYGMYFVWRTRFWSAAFIHAPR